MTNNEAAVASWDWWSVLNAGWFGVTIGLLLSVVATVQGVILYRRGKAVARLRIALTNQLLVDTAEGAVPGRLEFTYEGIVVPRVTSTSIGIWNDGTTTFRRDDIVEADPLRASLTGDGRILQVTIEGVSRPAIDVSTSIALASEDAYLHFDFLDPTDGFRLRVIHSGAPGALAIAGTIRGLPQGLSSHPRPELVPRVISVGLFIAGIGMIVLTLVGMIDAARKASWSQIGGVAAFFVSGVIFWIIVSLLERRTTPRKVKGVPPVILSDDVLYGRLTKPIELARRGE